jgi:hypothetical protein
MLFILVALKAKTSKLYSGNSNGRGRLSTIDLLVLTSLDKLLLRFKKLNFFTEQVTLFGRSTVLSFPLDLEFLALIIPYFT